MSSENKINVETQDLEKRDLILGRPIIPPKQNSIMSVNKINVEKDLEMRDLISARREIYEKEKNKSEKE